MHWSFGHKVVMVMLLTIPFLVIGAVVMYSPFNKSVADNSHYRIGVELQGRGDHSQAIIELNEAIKNEPSSVLALTKRGDSHFELGNFYQALQDYSKTISLRSEVVGSVMDTNIKSMRQAVVEGYLGRALVYTALGRDLKAQRDMAKAVEMGYDATEGSQAILDVKQQR